MQLSRGADEAPAIMEISDSPEPQQLGITQPPWSELEQRQRKYRLAAWSLAAALVVLGIFFMFADAIFPQDPELTQPNWSGCPVEPWTQKLRWVAPNMIMLGILTLVVQVFIEQMQTFRLRMGK